MQIRGEGGYERGQMPKSANVICEGSLIDKMEIMHDAGNILFKYLKLQAHGKGKTWKKVLNSSSVITILVSAVVR